jgi:O-acetyl-ADP-ribose deacetylase (regulator of RNase III)
MITYHTETDMFQLPADAFCHGVNTRGVIGGLALSVFNRFPEMKDVYQSMCQQNRLVAGEMFAVHYDYPDRNFWVYNLASQIEPGADASVILIGSSMEAMREHALINGVSTINSPLIGCGIGGLTWKQVRSELERVFGDSTVTLQVCTKEVSLPTSD